MQKKSEITLKIRKEKPAAQTAHLFFFQRTSQHQKKQKSCFLPSPSNLEFSKTFRS